MKYGTIVTNTGAKFMIYSNVEDGVALKIYDGDKVKRYELDKDINREEDKWIISIKGCGYGTIYQWEIGGENIIDPYGITITDDGKNIITRNKSTNKIRPNIPWEDTIIYEMNVGFFTKNNNSQVKYAGTFSGVIEKIPYLKDLGITAVELLPIFEWDEKTKRVNDKGQPIENIWGYNPINFFALTRKYSHSDMGGEIDEFKEMVDKLHKNGIEVILDVVYNHTAELGLDGYTYNFKKMANDEFYIMEHDGKEYANYSGCGNTFNCNTEISTQIIMDSLHYWYEKMGVDGFRFDLAPILGRDIYGQWGNRSLLDLIAEDKKLQNAKLISESWDLGGYYVGDMPNGFAEWNGKFRDTVRQFVKGDYGVITDFIKRIFGSQDMFADRKNAPYTSINFLTCHDGFTLMDLVSYSHKHNQVNGENNRDGENNNFSYNWGEEGPTSDPEIRNLRMQLLKNFLFILFISQGTPMLAMGDEMGRTKLGNNNTYCQDNEITWLDWNLLEENKELFQFTKNMIEFRKNHKIFHSLGYLVNEENVVTLNGVELNKPDLNYYSLSIAFEIASENKNYYVVINSYYKPLTFNLPSDKWTKLVDTSEYDSFRKVAIDENKILVNPRSCIILEKESK